MNGLRAPLVAVATLAVLAFGSSTAEAAAKGSRRSNARTGRLSPALAELVKASKRGDRAALGRVADRIGPARLGDAIASSQAGVGEAALAAAPLMRGGALLVGAIAVQLWASDPGRAIGAATALGTLLDGAVPTELEEWEVPPDVIAQACWGLKGVAANTKATIAVRLAAIDAMAMSTATCGPLGDVTPLLRDGSPAIRRAAALVTPAGDRRAPLLREAIADRDLSVSAAATAAACRIESRVDRAGRTEPPDSVALAAARAQATAPATSPEDAVEMLDCLAAGREPADRALLDQLQRRPPSPLRDRAVELAGGGVR